MPSPWFLEAEMQTYNIREAAALLIRESLPILDAEAHRKREKQAA